MGALLSLLLFGTFGWQELLIIAFILLLLFGTRLPNIMRNLGKGVTSFKKGLQDGKDEDEAGGSKGPDA
jgi:sec-independent protein translocase protein TatA